MAEEGKMWEELFRVEVPFSKKFGGVPMLKVPGLDNLMFGGSRAFWGMVIGIFESAAEKKSLSEDERVKINEVSETIRTGLKRREEAEHLARGFIQRFKSKDS